MAIGGWTLMLAASVAWGAALCAGMVVTRRWLPAVVGVGLLASTGVLLGLLAIWRDGHRPDVFVVEAVFIAFAASLGGFALFAALLPASTGRRTRAIRFEPSGGPGGIRVIVLVDAEPEDYTPSAVTEILEDLAESDVPLPPSAARPLVYASERARYRNMGGSPSRAMARRLTDAAGALISAREPTARTITAFCTAPDDLASTLAAETAQGTDRLVVVPASVARTRAIDRAQRVTDDLDLVGAGLRLRFASPLWESEATGAMIAGRCLDSFEGPPQEEDGVVLVCEGEPEQWQRGFSSTIEQETFFVQRIRASLLAAGFEDERVRVAWLEWEEPDVNEVLRHLAALGSRRIALMPACIPFDSVETTIDLRAAAERAATETGSEVFVLPGWGDDPVVADAICAAVFAALSESS